MICNFEIVPEIVKEHGLELLVVSYGGSCCNLFVDLMEKNGYRCKTEIWHRILCHCPKHIELDIPIIYIYDNPIKAFLSMKRRGTGYWDVNQQKMSNNYNTHLSDENLLRCMINQFTKWTGSNNNNLLIIKSSEIFNPSIISKLETFLNRKIDFFPAEYVLPKTHCTNIKNKNLDKLFKKYEKYIHKINNFIPNK